MPDDAQLCFFIMYGACSLLISIEVLCVILSDVLLSQYAMDGK